MVAVRRMGPMPYCSIFILAAKQHRCFPVYWRNSAVSIFIEYNTENKSVFSHCVDAYQLAFDGWVGVEEREAYIKAIVIAVSLCIVCVAVSIPVINKRQL